MGFAVDVLNSTLVDLLPDFEETFLLGHPLLQYITKGKVKKSMLQGPYREFTVVTGGVGTVTGILTGSETLSSVRRNTAVRGNEYGYRFIYHWDVPGKDLAEVSGKQDLARIVDNYPKIAIADAMQRMSRQVARGSASSGSDTDGTGMAGIVTLNSDQTYNPQGLGARTGIFQYVVPASQTATVHALPMAAAAASPTAGWYHQYAHISSFSLDGLRTLRQQQRLANTQGMAIDGQGVDLMLADGLTYDNYVEALDDKVIEINEINNPASKFTKRDGIKHGGADLYFEPDIDITDTTSFSSANPRLGVLYGFTTSKWELIQLGNNADKASKGNFELQTPVAPLPDQDAWQWRVISYLNLCCHSLRNQLCMTGGAQT